MPTLGLTRPDIRQEVEAYLEFIRAPEGVLFCVECTFMDLRNLTKGIQTHSLTTYVTLAAALEHFALASVRRMVWVRLKVKFSDFDEMLASKCADCDMRESWSWRNNGRGNHADDVPSERAIQLHLGNELEAYIPIAFSNTSH